jgi:hypothetical protein
MEKDKYISSSNI